jgi:hypothetical protein
MMERFGIRGVQYGNYLTDADRAYHARQAYVALHDLGDVLGLPDALISYNGRLGAAFGARGVGQAAAHYEPALQVINITRGNTGGSLAHEWGHFLDHMLGSFSRVDPTHSVMASDHLVTGELAEDPSGRLRAALAKVMVAMHTAGPDEKIRVGGRTTTVGQHLSGKGPDEIARWRETAKNAAGRSQYATDAARLGAYWRRPHEMFARAFETYVADKLETAGRVNSYLVGPRKTRAPHHVDRETGEFVYAYPQGEERERINRAFDEFMAELRGHGIITKALAAGSRLAMPPAAERDRTIRIVRTSEAAKAAAGGPMAGRPGLVFDTMSRRWKRAEGTEGGVHLDPETKRVRAVRRPEAPGTSEVITKLNARDFIQHQKRATAMNGVLNHFDRGHMEFRNPKTEDRHAVVIPDASEPGRWRFSEYDSRGFAGHRTFDTPHEAAAAAS